MILISHVNRRKLLKILITFSIGAQQSCEFWSVKVKTERRYGCQRDTNDGFGPRPPFEDNSCEDG